MALVPRQRITGLCWLRHRQLEDPPTVSNEQAASHTIPIGSLAHAGPVYDFATKWPRRSPPFPTVSFSRPAHIRPCRAEFSPQLDRFITDRQNARDTAIEKLRKAAKKVGQDMMVS